MEVKLLSGILLFVLTTGVHCEVNDTFDLEDDLFGISLDRKDGDLSEPNNNLSWENILSELNIDRSEDPSDLNDDLDWEKILSELNINRSEDPSGQNDDLEWENILSQLNIDRQENLSEMNDTLDWEKILSDQNIDRDFDLSQLNDTSNWDNILSDLNVDRQEDVPLLLNETFDWGEDVPVLNLDRDGESPACCAEEDGLLSCIIINIDTAAVRDHKDLKLDILKEALKYTGDEKDGHESCLYSNKEAEMVVTYEEATGAVDGYVTLKDGRVFIIEYCGEEEGHILKEIDVGN